MAPAPEAVAVPAIPALEWLTVERVIWGIVIAIAAFVRLNDLAWTSLSDSEAALANAALGLFNLNASAATHSSPLLVGLSGVLMAIVGASDAAARVVPALAGLVPVVLTYRLRPLLGRVGALVTALIVAFSATYLYSSRTVNGDSVAFAGIYIALVGLYECVTNRTARSVYVLAAGTAVALISSPIAYTVLLIVAVFAGIAMLLRARRVVDVSDWDMAFYVLRGTPGVAERALAVFALVFAGGATAALLNPGGLQAAANVGADWLGAWVAAPNRTPAYVLDLLVRYELLPTVFGLAGLLFWLSRGDRLSLFLAWWLGAAVTIYILVPDKSPGDMLVVLLPLIWTSGRLVESLANALRRDFSASNEGTFLLLGLITLGIIYLNLAGFVQDGTSSHMVVVLIGVTMLFLIVVMTAALGAYYHIAGDTPAGGALMLRPAPAWGEGLLRAYTVAGAVILIALAVLEVRAGLGLNFNEADNPREALTGTPTTREARALAPMLADLSNRWDGDPTTAPIAASASIGPALRWYLRDFQAVRFVDGSVTTAAEPIVIVPAADTQPGFANAYAAQKIRWRWEATALPPGAAAFLRWTLYNGIQIAPPEQLVPPSYDIIVYVQQK